MRACANELTVMSAEDLLVEISITGSETCWREFYDRFHFPLSGYLTRVMGNSRDVEDLIQEVFLRVHRNLHQYKQGENVTNWVMAIAQNIAFNAQRDSRRQKRFNNLPVFQIRGEQREGGEFDPGCDPIDDYQPPDTDGIEALQAAMHTLDDEQREIIQLVFYEQLPYRDVAERLGFRSKSSIETRLERIFDKLRDQIEPEEVDEPVTLSNLK